MRTLRAAATHCPGEFDATQEWLYSYSTMPKASKAAHLKNGSPSLLRLLTARPRDQALFAAYDGPLYNVSRPDGTSKNIGVLKAGGFADIKTHDGEPGALLSPARSA